MHPCLNNSKWREILTLLSRHEMPIEIAFLGDEQFRQAIIFPESALMLDQVKDASIHGPFLLKDIFAIRFARFELKRKPETGQHFKDDSRYQKCVEAIHKLGQIMSKEEDYGMTIFGYQKP